MKVLFAVSNEEISESIVKNIKKNINKLFHIKTFITLMQY